MSYYDEYFKWQDFNFKEYFKTVTEQQVARVITKNKLNKQDFLKLLSPAAVNYLEPVARKAHQLTVQNFGHIMLLYAPLYLANYCENQCVYCGFNVNNQIKRRKLSISEVSKEGKKVAEKGIKHILLLTGCSRKKTPVSYIGDCVRLLQDIFPAIAIEVYALETAEYRKLVAAGATGLTIYQEVYDEKMYRKVHPGGPKRNYRFRLEAPERGCRAGMRTVNIGALLGLFDWRREAFFSGLHARYLQNNYLETEINISVPRLRPHQGGYRSPYQIEDRELVQIILAYRLFLPRVGINLSTREGATLRDNLLPLGITRLSAESSTAVGGYTTDKTETEQFQIADNRSVIQIKEILQKKGFQSVFKDWHQNINTEM